MLAGAVDRRLRALPEAVANFKRAVELDPRNFIVLMEAASTFQGTRRYRGSHIVYTTSALSHASPNDPFARFLLGFNSFARTGDAAEWRKPLERIAQQGPEAARSVAFPLLVCSWMQRDKSEAEKAAGADSSRKGLPTVSMRLPIPREYCVGRTAWLFGDKDAGEHPRSPPRGRFSSAQPSSNPITRRPGVILA